MPRCRFRGHVGHSGKARGTVRLRINSTSLVFREGGEGRLGPPVRWVNILLSMSAHTKSAETLGSLCGLLNRAQS